MTALPRSRPARVLAGHGRTFLGLAVGLIAFALLSATDAWALAPVTRAIIAWDIGVLAFLVLIALLFSEERRDRMQHDAAMQEEGEWTIFSLTLAAALFSFFALTTEFSGSSSAPPDVKRLHLAVVTATLALSWLMTQTVFALRYAHEYYSVSPGRTAIDAGLEFPGEDAPDYLDFMYFALVLGMTFQVSDVQITARKLRRLATLHGLIGFLFNTIIIALTVNIAAGLL